ncbi:MAG: CinA family protein [Pirellulales bacterium]
METRESEPEPVAVEIARLLAARNLRLVLAESCTGGLAAGWLAGVPGISEWWCGSLVTYRIPSKIGWLGLPPSVLEAESDVSPVVSELMARQALVHTPEAAIAAAITGHLGPHAPPGQDGVVHSAIARRDGPCDLRTGHLLSTSRVSRLHEATQFLLCHLRDQLGN